MTYQYQCNDCLFSFDVAISAKELPGLTIFCPTCSSSNVNRKYTIPYLQFKGSGFYSTDNKKKEVKHGDV